MTAKLYPEYKELVKVAVNWEYGTTYTHDEIAKILGLPARTPKYYGAVKNANNHLLNAQKTLKVIPKIGYKVMLPTEYTEEVVRQIKLSKRRSGHAVKIAMMAPIDKMSIDEQMRHRQISDRAANYNAMTSGALVESRLLLAKKKD